MRALNKRSLTASIIGLFVGVAIAIMCQTQANLPVADSQGRSLPSLAPLLEKVNPAVVNISVTQTQQSSQSPLLNDPFFRQFFNIPDNYQPQQRKSKSAGSGVIVDAQKGIIITNHHVVKNASEIIISLSDGRNFEAELVGNDTEVDIAILRIKADKLTSIPWANSDMLRVGDFSIAIGNPFGLGQTVTTGIVSALGRSGLGIQGYENFIQTDASINPGNSGGALINLKGELIGINNAIIAPSGGNVGIGFAIPTNMAKYSMEQILKHGKVSRGQLGISMQPLSRDLAVALGAKQDQQGIIINSVKPNSPAANSGLQEGDIITHVNDKRVKTPAELRNSIGIKQPGQAVKVNLLRNGNTKSVNVTLRKNVFSSPAQLSQRKPTAAQPQQPAVAQAIPGATLKNTPQGILVESIANGSMAANSGLRVGDVIIGVNKRRVKNKSSLGIMLERGGKSALLQIRRGTSALFLILRR